MKHSVVVSSKEAGTRLDVFLTGKYRQLSREKIKQAIISGSVLVDGVLCNKTSLKLRDGQVVGADINLPDPDLKASSLELKKVYEDKDFLIIDKPAGLVVHPGIGVSEGTVSNALLSLYPEMANFGDKSRPGIVHRLDKDTSGLLLVAKNLTAYDYAKDLFKQRLVEKHYIALLHGLLEKKHGFIDRPLKLLPKKRRVIVAEDGKLALTEYKVLSHFFNRHKEGEGVDYYSQVLVKLHTGRTHQIRVHFSDLGYPIVGDPVYSKVKSNLPGVDRQFLHAQRLIFKRPDGLVLDVESPLPTDLQSILDGLSKL